MRQRGQIIVILLLIILVSLTVGLAVVQNSLTDLSTSTKVDQSSRAFAAAEAGLESALATLNPPVNIPISNLGNNASANVIIAKDLPAANTALEYPPLTKADFAQFWFQNPLTAPTIDAADYRKTVFEIYFGSCDSQTDCKILSQANDEPAIEVNVLMKEASSGNFYVIRRYYDPNNGRTNGNNAFEKLINGQNVGRCHKTNSNVSANTNMGNNRYFYCYVRVDLNTVPSGNPNSVLRSLNDTLILARIRLLYSSDAHRIAVRAHPCIWNGSLLNLCPYLGPGPIPKPTNPNLPPQASMYTSKGTSGDAVRQLRIFKEQDVVPFFFDFAIYSEGMITK